MDSRNPNQPDMISWSGPRPHNQQRPTIGVFANKQIYAGTTIGRFEPLLLEGIRTAARDYGCNLLLACGLGPNTVPFQRQAAWPVRLSQSNFLPVGPWNCSGLIALPPFTDIQQRSIRQFLPPGYPIVFTYPQQGYTSVAPVNSSGIQQAMDHLLSHGHQRIVFIADDLRESGDGAERLAAYRTAVARYGLPTDERFIGYGQHDPDQSYKAMQEILASGLEFTAVLGSNDESAIGAMRALAEAGRRIPEQVAVVGFDDVPMARAQNPALTTVRHPTFELGYRSVEVLLEAIAGQTLSPGVFEIPTRLIIRESCGCRPALTPTLPAAFQGANRLFQGEGLASEMAAAVCSEARHLAPETIYPECFALIHSLTASATDGEPALFRKSLDTLIERVEQAQEDPYIVQAAIACLQTGLPLLFSEFVSPAPSRAGQFLTEAFLTVGEHIRRYNVLALVYQTQMIDRLNQLTSGLLALLDQTQIFEVLSKHLPGLNLKHAVVALFEPDGSDPFAWSRIYGTAGVEVGIDGADYKPRFQSRSFPPEGLYPDNEPFSLALLPLVLAEGMAGFVAFDSNNLDPLAAIVLHLSSAMRSSELYHQATEGRRLAEEADQLKSRFLSTVSHELRTPLNLIAGLSEVLLQEQANGERALPGQAQQDLQQIYNNTQYLGHLIGDVLDLASSDAGQLHLVREPVNLAEMLSVILSTGEQLARDKGLAWQVSIAQDLPQVWGDRTRLRQVVLNLVSNAVKFTPSGRVVLEASASPDGVMVMVSDTGIGIPPEEQSLIFDPFRRADAAIRHNYGGLGLGLSICKQLITLHNGTIRLSSPGKLGGTSIFFTLPAISRPEPAALISPADSGYVLVLAETLADTFGLRDYLLNQGFLVKIETIDLSDRWLAAALKVPPGAVVFGKETAQRYGWSILKTLKSNPATVAVPALCYALSAENDSGALLELDHILKPLNQEQFSRALDEQLPKGSEPALKRVVVVDDNLATLEFHVRLVRQQLPHGQVFTARNGREALTIIRQVLPDLVLLDLMMPELDGFGVLEELRSEAATRSIPVLIMTAQTLSDADVARLQHGVAAVLHKGVFSIAETLDHISAALARHEKLGSAAQRLVRRAMIFIHQHYAEPVTRKQIAHYVGASEDYLTDCFHQELGLTPVVYLNRFRVSKARDLLELGVISVADVAEAVGYSDRHYFTRVFQREVGVSPKAYQRGQRPAAI